MQEFGFVFILQVATNKSEFLNDWQLFNSLFFYMVFLIEMENTH